jgi:hypothetical protein
LIAAGFLLKNVFYAQFRGRVQSVACQFSSSSLWQRWAWARTTVHALHLSQHPLALFVAILFGPGYWSFPSTSGFVLSFETAREHHGEACSKKNTTAQNHKKGTGQLIFIIERGEV